MFRSPSRLLAAASLVLALGAGSAASAHELPRPAAAVANRGPGPAARVCQPTTAAEIESLFIRWNDSLQTGDPAQVVANYAPDSLLLPTLSNIPRYTVEQKEDYFDHFLVNDPYGTIDERWVSIGCGTAIDSGLYTFTMQATGDVVKARYTFTYIWDGKTWLISSHHSSLLPEPVAS